MNGALNQQTFFEKDLEEIFFLDPLTEEEDGEKKLEHTINRFISFSFKSASETNLFTKLLCLEFTFTPKIFHLSDYEAYTENIGVKNYNDRVSRNFYQDVELGDDTTPYRGLINEGSTCYINSLLQTLYSIGKFRSSIYRLQST